MTGEQNRSNEELTARLREYAEWAEGNIWEVPIMLPDHLKQAADEIETMRRDLRECVNELCLHCGSYVNAHMGACDGCRWAKWKEMIA